MTLNPYNEEPSSQLPALEMLVNLGFTYLSPKETVELRQGNRRKVVLEPVLSAWIMEHNAIDYRGKSYPFSTENVHKAVQALADHPMDDGLRRTTEAVYDLLTLGKNLPQAIEGDTKSYPLRYIDWQNPANNVYHVTDEYEVERESLSGEQHRRPDIVCFVNGIPLVVIECKSPNLVVPNKGTPVQQGISQMIRNQQPGEIQRLFIYSQVLMSLAMNDAMYATATTKKKFWSIWKEGRDIDAEVEEVMKRSVDAGVMDKIFAYGSRSAWRSSYEPLAHRAPTEQDRMLYSLARPERLLELAYQFILFDKGEKKIARFQQYHAVQLTLQRVRERKPGGQREGGVIWHTTGTGKSLTMVMFAKALALEPSITNPRILLVSDRINLDRQIHQTFNACGKSAVRAKTGKDLINLITEGTADIITTVNAKFVSARRQRKVEDLSTELFVLVDEGHRSQSGSDPLALRSMSARDMRRIFPNACYIAFTGTPLLKKDRKTTEQEFGRIIHRYTIDEAQRDKMVVPLLYEGRMAVQRVDQKSIDSWFNRVTRNLSDDQKKDLKRKFARSEHINETEQRLRQVAYDVSKHYAENWKGTKFKAMLAASSRAVAVRYKDLLDEFGEVTSEVVISGPDTREGETEVDRESKDIVKAFWKRMMDRYGSEKQYEDEITDAFKFGDDIDILIVVSKLLTGFDAPRATILYMDKHLQEHNIIQAISRVNRLYDGKDFGFIIDYRGILQELDEAMDLYSVLSEYFDDDEIAGAVINVKEAINDLSTHHAAVTDIFKVQDNPRDLESCEKLLADESLRDKFYANLSQFGRTLKIALSSADFIDNTSTKLVQMYSNDVRFYTNMRQSVGYRYAEKIDFGAYEDQIKKLLDSHVSSTGIEQVTDEFNIHEKEARQEEVTKVHGEGAMADHMAHKLKAVCNEKMDEDPIYYRRFGSLVQQAIDEYRAQRLTEREYLETIKKLNGQVEKYEEDGLPASLKTYPEARAFYHVVSEPVTKYIGENDKGHNLAADIGIQISKIINKHRVVDWVNSLDTQNRIRNDLDDYLFDLREQTDLSLENDEIDEILEGVLDIARRRERL
ncbi:MAG: type I restriction endonuclease subunit R [Candidatus Marinimicrobia bacterium]|nr:type I restriction endonuclease subunit R [Candidatus Neomarinimicrobiota bacterium]